MKKIFEMWQWKLKIVILSLVFLSLPVILNWDNFKAIEIFFIFTGFPILIWLTVTYSLYEYGKEITNEFKKDEIKSRYSIKSVNPDFYQNINVKSEESNGISKLGEIEFLDIKVPVYHDKYMESEDSGIASWQARNPDAFYTGTVFMDWETGKMTYPNGETPPEPKHEDCEMLPKFVVTGAKELNSKTITGILNYFSKEYMRRNKSWLENKNK